MVRSFRWIGRAHRGLHGDHPDGGRTGPAPGGPKHSGGWRSPTILLRDAKAPWRRRKIVGRSHCGSGPLAVRSPSEGRARLLFGAWALPIDYDGPRTVADHSVPAVATNMKRNTSS